MLDADVYQITCIQIILLKKAAEKEHPSLVVISLTNPYLAIADDAASKRPDDPFRTHKSLFSCTVIIACTQDPGATELRAIHKQITMAMLHFDWVVQEGFAVQVLLKGNQQILIFQLAFE